MGTAILVMRSSGLTKAQWDALLTNINTFINNNPGLNLSLDKLISQFQEAPP